MGLPCLVLPMKQRSKQYGQVNKQYVLVNPLKPLLKCYICYRMFVVQTSSIKASDKITWAQATMLMHTNWGSSNESQCKACTQIFWLKDVICKEKFLLFLPTAIPGQWPQSKIGQITTIGRALKIDLLDILANRHYTLWNYAGNFLFGFKGCSQMMSCAE